MNANDPGNYVRRSQLERDAMAWPPAEWERDAAGWRYDVGGPDPFVPYAGEAVAEVEVRSARPPRYGAVVREILETVVLTALIFIGIRLVVQNFRIEGSSMEPTLHTKEYLLVNKLSYGRFGSPQRGDIIVFQAWNQDKDFIKRVVALPGDEVAIHDRHVYVNGSPLEESYTLDPPADNMPSRHLPADEYFVMGDNRLNSADSRQYGPLPADRIIGKAWLTYWPPDQVGLIPDSHTSFASAAP